MDQNAPTAAPPSVWVSMHRSFLVARGWARQECWAVLSPSHLFEWQLCGTRALSSVTTPWTGSAFTSVCVPICHHDSRDASPWDTLFGTQAGSEVRCADLEALWVDVESCKKEESLRSMRDERYNAAIHASNLRSRALAEERFCISAGGQRPPHTEQFRWDGYLGVCACVSFENIAELVGSPMGHWLDERICNATLMLHSRNKMWHEGNSGLRLFAAHRNEMVGHQCCPVEISDCAYSVTEAASAEMYRLMQRSNSNSLTADLDGRVLQVFRKVVSDVGVPSNATIKSWKLQMTARLHGCGAQKADAGTPQGLQWKVQIQLTRWMANDATRKTYKCEEKHTMLCAASLGMAHSLA